MMDRFMAMYPGLKTFIAATKAGCKERGFVQTLLGRRRTILGIASSDREERARAERQAVNTLCQGSAADLIKLAMINIHHSLAQLADDQALTFRHPRAAPGGALYLALDDDVSFVLQVSP
jgi:DNA polymerase theta